MASGRVIGHVCAVVQASSGLVSPDGQISQLLIARWQSSAGRDPEHPHLGRVDKSARRWRLKRVRIRVIQKEVCLLHFPWNIASASAEAAYVATGGHPLGLVCHPCGVSNRISP